MMRSKAKLLESLANQFLEKTSSEDDEDEIEIMENPLAGEETDAELVYSKNRCDNCRRRLAVDNDGNFCPNCQDIFTELEYN